MRKQTIVNLSLLVLVMLIFSGCIVTDGMLFGIDLEWLDAEAGNSKLIKEDNLLNVLANKTQRIKAKGFDRYGNSDEILELEEPQWYIFNDSNEKSIGDLNITQGSIVEFTASDNIDATGKIRVSINQPKTGITEEFEFKVKVVEEFPTDEEE